MELNDLLASAMRGQEEKAAIHAAKKTLVTARTGSDEFIKANEYVRQWEQENLWSQVALELQMTEETCTCGNKHLFVGGLMLVSQHKQHPDRITMKAVLDPASHPELPKRTHIRPIAVHICPSCALQHNFPDWK